MVSKDCDRGYLARDKDFKFVKDKSGYRVGDKGLGYFHYIGNEKIVKIPHIIQGHEITSYYKMFKGNSIKEIISRNKDITNMSHMFSSIKTDKLILYSFDSSNVVDMGWMFSKVNIKKLDLHYLDTSNVTQMSSMFAFSNIINLNLSSFNTLNVTNMYGMFANIKSLKTLDLSSFNFLNLEKDLAEYIFASSNIKEVYVRSKEDIIILKKNLSVPTSVVLKIKE